ncbi:hypothetical protein P3T73_16150 [Kiritimatiellota bacterium B12222]|nr:hypothetical protein P3T73_16150 [Kiritimatiellota bacterium B12222]
MMDFSILKTEALRVARNVCGLQQINYFPYALPQPGRIFHIFDAPFFRQVRDHEAADWIVVMVNSNFPELAEKDIVYLNATKKPILLLDRIDSPVVWFRQFDRLENLVYVLKNRNFRDLEWNNKPLFNWRMHLELIRQSLGLPETYNEYLPDASSEKGLAALEPALRPEDMTKVRTLNWDFFSSHMGEYMLPHLGPSVPFEARDIDLFCVSSGKRGILGTFRERLKEEVERIGKKHGLKVCTESLPKAEFNERLRHSKISISAPGWGEQVHADWYAVHSAVGLFKPDCSYMKMQPDLYQERYVDFFPHSFEGLEEKILEKLSGYEAYTQKVLAAQKLIRSTSKRGLQQELFELLMVAR